MIINFQKWKNENVSEKLRAKVDQIKNSINYWDQDVLNSFVDGEFKELPLNLNYTVDVSNGKAIIPALKYLSLIPSLLKRSIASEYLCSVFADNKRF